MATIPSNRHSGLWRLLVLDCTDRGDPLWLIATVAPGDVRPAGNEQAPGELITAWVAARGGLAHAALTPLRAAAWRVDEDR
jgi:hypothetical protein